MSEFLPKKFSGDDDQEDEGNLIIKNLLRKNNRVKPRLEGNDKTPGRDGFIELRDEETVLGKLEVQAKPVDSEYKKKSQLAFKLPRTLIGYSERAGEPVILICYDRGTDKAYWKPITPSLFEGAGADQDSKVIHFVPADEIADGLPYTDAWFSLLASHQAALKLGRMLGAAVEILKSDKTFGAALDSPEDIAALFKQLKDTAGAQYKVRLDEAQKLFDQGEIEAAAKILGPLAEELVKANQAANVLFDVYVLLGNCHYRLEEFKEAEDCFREAMKLEKDNPRAQANLAHIFYVRNINKKEALDLARAAYDKRPDHEHTMATYLMCLSLNKDFKKIEEIAEKQKALIDKSSVLQVALGQIAKEQEDYASSCSLFKKAIELDAKNYHARILYAESVYKQVRASGLKLISEGIVPDPEKSGKEMDDAVSELGVAIEYFTNTTDRGALYRAYDTRSVIYMIRGDFEKALSDCDKMDAVLPDREFAKIVRAQIYTQLNRFDEVITLMEPLAGGDRRDVLQALAYSHYRLNHWGEAAGYFSKYIDEDNDSAQELCAYVQCLWFSDQKKKAYQGAYKLRKTGNAPKEIMREVELKRLTELQDWSACLDVLEDLLKVEPQNPDTWIQRVAMYMQLNNQQQAMKFYRELPRNLITDDWARQYLAHIEEGLRQLGWL